MRSLALENNILVIRFHELDADCDGCLTETEFQSLLRNLDLLISVCALCPALLLLPNLNLSHVAHA
jgi:hypothetical protein